MNLEISAKFVQELNILTERNTIWVSKNYCWTKPPKKGIQKGMEKGFEKGMEECAKQALKEIALKMMNSGLDVALIANITRLSPEAIEKLK